MVRLIRPSAGVARSTFVANVTKSMLQSVHLWKIPILGQIITLDINILLK
jgi:hypothetical protein